ncbi:MAG: hypothetical protein IAF38_16535 [Bacteroidia bacterium]|nr:hypothetical protein [Bacteroidia bacterium]
MKAKTFNLKISNPCTENWEEMTPMQNGRLCSNCSKVVVDFSNMSATGIADYFKNANGKVCGQFKQSQLEVNYIPAYKNIFSFNSNFLRLSLAGILTFSGVKGFSQSGNAKAPITVKDNAGRKKNLSQKNNAKTNPKLSVQLILTDKKTGKTILGGGARLDGTAKNFTADKTGAIKIEIPDSLKDKTLNIYFHASGYASAYTTVDLKKENSSPLIISLEMKEEIMVKGDVGIDFIEPKKCGNK